MSDRMDIERAGYPGPDGPAPLSPKYSTDPRLNAALEADARKLEAMGGDPGITLDDAAPLSPIALDKLNIGEALRASDLYGSWWNLETPAKRQEFVDHLNAQYRALVARVAQEEREKVLGEMAQKAEGYRGALKIDGVSEYTKALARRRRDALLLAIDLFRGTP